MLYIQPTCSGSQGEIQFFAFASAFKKHAAKLPSRANIHLKTFGETDQGRKPMEVRGEMVARMEFSSPNAE